MGYVFSRVFSSLWGQGEVRVLILGLDGAGKTTILYKLQLGEIVSTIPTIGFNVETVKYQNVKLNVWDLGGQSSIRPYWRCYYTNSKAIIFVIDSQDRDRITSAANELYAMLREEELRSAAFLVFANKQDMAGAMTVEEVSRALQLTRFKDRDWTIVGTSAVTGDGLETGMDWLVNVIKDGSKQAT